MTTTQRQAQDRYTQVLKAFERHPQREKLMLAGKQADSLLRALIPLYVTERYGAESQVTSGVAQRVWQEFGVRVQATVIARALLQHVGFSRRTRDGLRITPNGTKYVEAALR